MDFGASDGPMTDEQLAASKIKIIHIPTVLGADVPAFNVPGVTDIKFSGDVLADIFLGKIVNWSDGRIARDNPGVKLPEDVYKRQAPALAWPSSSTSSRPTAAASGPKANSAQEPPSTSRCRWRRLRPLPLHPLSSNRLQAHANPGGVLLVRC